MLNVQYHHVKFDIYYIYGIWENHDFKVFDTWPTKNMQTISLEHTRHTIHIFHELLNVCSNHTTFKLQ